MGLFERKIRPAFVAAPVEPALAVPDEVRVADIDAKLANISEALQVYRAEGLISRADRLLDLRNAIRPAKGCVDSIIDNHQENPW